MTITSAPPSRATSGRARHSGRAIEQNGDIYLGKYAGWYSVRQEAYFDEAETTVGADDIRREPLGSPVEWAEEETYFFRLSAYQDKLLALYAKSPDFVAAARAPQRSCEFRQRRPEGPFDLANDVRLGHQGAGRPMHVMYVWVDALTNYITGAGFPDVESDPNSGVTGRPICTSSARISSASTPCTGRHS